MRQQSPTPIVLDASVLLNFVKIARIELLGQLGTSVVLLDQVFDEVMRREQRKAVEGAVKAGYLICKVCAIRWRSLCLPIFERTDGLERVSARFWLLRLIGIGSLGFRIEERGLKGNAGAKIWYFVRLRIWC